MPGVMSFSLIAALFVLRQRDRLPLVLCVLSSHIELEAILLTHMVDYETELEQG